MKFISSNMEYNRFQGAVVEKSSGISSYPTYAKKESEDWYSYGSFSMSHREGTRAEMEEALQGSVIAPLLDHLD